MNVVLLLWWEHEGWASLSRSGAVKVTKARAGKKMPPTLSAQVPCTLSESMAGFPVCSESREENVVCAAGHAHEKEVPELSDESTSPRITFHDNVFSHAPTPIAPRQSLTPPPLPPPLLPSHRLT